MKNSDDSEDNTHFRHFSTTNLGPLHYEQLQEEVKKSLLKVLSNPGPPRVIIQNINDIEGIQRTNKGNIQRLLNTEKEFIKRLWNFTPFENKIKHLLEKPDEYGK